MDDVHPDDPDDPLVLPPAPPPPARAPLPVLSAVAPVFGAVLLWAITGSVFALWFAALGPVLVGASALDARRAARRQRRLSAREASTALARLRAAVATRHAAERAELWAQHPDVAGFAGAPADIWRPVPGRREALVVGRGAAESRLRVTGGDDGAAARDLQRTARRLEDAPITIPLDAGVAVVGPQLLAGAVVRALALQVCLAAPPGAVRLHDGGPPELQGLPHATAPSGRVLCIPEDAGALTVTADIPLVRVDPGRPPPPRCAAVLTLTGIDTARLDHDGTSRDVRIEALSAAQAREITTLLAARDDAGAAPREAAVGLAGLLADAGPADRGRLPAPIGTIAGQPAVLDLVRDGPHAIVIGVTGSGKSELLTSWIVALCRGHGPERVSFLLVDFKGGRTFDALLPLPQVTGVLTDLDEAAAVRAVESLRAEIRHRERMLAAAGAREIAEVELARLVVVVDEYAALVSAHPALHDLFGDIAARGRALGIHLILASQRAAGVFRDAVLANAPLRISLRVTDAGDSRAVLGTEEAVRLSGDVAARGTALVRRAADAAPRSLRVALCDDATIARTAAAVPGPRARRPWLPALPEIIDLDAVREPGRIVLGVADQPDRQRQPAVDLTPGEPGLVVIGRAGSGRSAIVRAVAAQAAGVLVIPGEPESAWDASVRLEELRPGTAVLVDDADALLARLPADYAATLLERLEVVARTGRARGVVLILTLQRLNGGLSRLAELIPRRAILALASRADHVAAGGDPSGFLPDPPPGRGRLGGELVQFAFPAEGPGAPEQPAVPVLRPGRRPVAFVAPAGPGTRLTLAAWEDDGLHLTHVADADAALRPAVVVWGTPEEWLAQWHLLARARADADLIVDVACAAEYRVVTGRRDLPPYALSGARRAWLVRGDPDSPPRRVVLPAPRRVP